MMNISSELRNSPQFALRRALLVPICLCLVASVHMYRVFAFGQTAWKGGGFGMFSTIDGENARFLKAYLLTEHGEVPLVIPASLRKRMAELRAAPNQQLAEEFAQKLAKLQWHDTQTQWSRVAEAVFLAGDQPATSAIFSTETATAPVWEFHAPGTVSTFEALSKKENSAAIPVEQVRVEVWRYRYTAQEHRLEGERLYQAIVKHSDEMQKG